MYMRGGSSELQESSVRPVIRHFQVVQELRNMMHTHPRPTTTALSVTPPHLQLQFMHHRLHPTVLNAIYPRASGSTTGTLLFISVSAATLYRKQRHRKIQCRQLMRGQALIPVTGPRNCLHHSLWGWTMTVTCFTMLTIPTVRPRSRLIVRTG